MEAYERDNLIDAICQKLNEAGTPATPERRALLGKSITAAPDEVLELMADTDTRIELDSVGMVRLFNADNVLLGTFELADQAKPEV
jgi:hypothetical protein